MSVYSRHDIFQGPCSFCDHKMSHGMGGFWGVEHEVFCCTECARNVLPQFLADSLYARNLSDAQREVAGPVMAALQHALARRAESRTWNGTELDRRMDEEGQKQAKALEESLLDTYP